MATGQVAAGSPVDVRIVLAVLWAAQMLSSLNGDTYRLSASVAPLGADPGLLSAMSAILVWSIVMSPLTLMLPYAVSRWMNRIVGLFYAAVTIAFEVMHVVVWHSVGYEIVWATGQLVFAVLVVWYAWRWAKPDSNEANPA